MMKNLILLSLTTFTLCAVGCASTSGGAEPERGSPQTLSVRGDCSFESCGVPPSNLASAPVLSCSPNAGQACGWASASSTVSYRPCADSECPPKPTVTCPADTVKSSQQCGSENDGACLWTSTCVPPRNTTPCPDAHGCDGLPVLDIGIICSDGTTGGFACVTDGQRCKYERNCD